MNPSLEKSIPRLFFAFALIAFGIQQFVFGFFIAGRPLPWPEGMPGESLFAYFSGAIFVLTGIGIITQTKPRLTLVITGVLVLVWAGARNLFAVLTTLDYGGLLTNTCKSFTLGTGAFLIAKTFSAEGGTPLVNKLINIIAPLARYAMGSFLIIAGIQHFLFAAFVKFLIPAFIPWAAFWTYFAGVALILGGLGVIIGMRLAALLSACMVFAWVILLHIPRALTEGNQNEWTAVFEALAVSGLLVGIAITLTREK